MKKSLLTRGFQINYEIDRTSRLLNQVDVLSNVYIVDMYNYYADYFYNTKVKKITIFITEDDNGRMEVFPEGIFIIPAHFDLLIYSSISSQLQKHFILDLIHDHVINFAHIKHWDEKPFFRSRKKVIKHNFVFRDCWKNPTANPTQIYTAQICWQYDINIKVYLEVSGKESMVYLLSVLPPSMGALEEIFGQLQWQSDNTIKITCMNKRDFWIVDIESGKVEFFYPRAIAGNPHGLYDLGIMYLEGRLVLRDQVKGVDLLRQSARKNFSRAVKKLAQLGLELSS